MTRYILQTIITIGTLVATWLIASKERKQRQVGFILAFIYQPVWIYVTVMDDQWGLLPLTIWFLYVRYRGIRNNQ